MCCSAGHGPLISQMIQVVTKPSIPRALSLPEIVCVCLSMIICRKHLITSILHIIIRMLFWVGIGIHELRIKLLSKFADQLTQSCPNFGSLGIGTRLGSGWVRRQRQISELLILVASWKPLYQSSKSRNVFPDYRKSCKSDIPPQITENYWKTCKVLKFHRNY